MCINERNDSLIFVVFFIPALLRYCFGFYYIPPNVEPEILCSAVCLRECVTRVHIVLSASVFVFFYVCVVFFYFFFFVGGSLRREHYYERGVACSFELYLNLLHMVWMQGFSGSGFLVSLRFFFHQFQR